LRIFLVVSWCSSEQIAVVVVDAMEPDVPPKVEYLMWSQ
jgi:hypothetical protein